MQALRFLFVCALMQSMQVAANAPDCASLDSCYTAALSHADLNRSAGAVPSQTDQALIARVTQFGEPALPRLMELLADKNEALASLAVTGLNMMPPLDARYLPQVTQALARGLYAYPLLAKMSDPRATQLLIDAYLTKKPFERQLLNGHKTLALPFLLDATSCPALCLQHERDIHYYMSNLYNLVRELADESAKLQLAEQMLDHVNNPALLVKVRVANLANAAGLINDVPALSPLKPRIETLCAQHADLADSCKQAFVTLRLQGAWHFLAAQLEKADVTANDWQVDQLLNSLATFGKEAKSSSTVVQKFLQADDLSLRKKAATTLLSIDPQGALPILLQKMRDPYDAPLSYALVQLVGPFLATVQSQAADRKGSAPSNHSPPNSAQSNNVRQALVDIQTNYWYPPVRTAAKRWLESPAQAAIIAEEIDNSMREIAPTDIENLSCELAPQAVSPATKGYAVKPSTQLTYWIENWSFDNTKPATEDVSIGMPWSGNPKRIERVPDIALQVGHGWLTGSDRGEWGGELVYLPEQAPAQPLVADNIQAIVTLGKEHVAVAGLAHMMMDYGRIYRITQQPSEASKPVKMQAKHWIALPAHVTSSSLLQNGDLLLTTGRYGSFLLSKDGTLRMAPCRGR